MVTEPATAESTRPPTGTRHSRYLVVALCFSVIVADGYDLIVYGTVVPSLLGGEWALSPGEAGRIGSIALVGMLIGALVIGTVTDTVGRRRILIGCVAWFSAAMALAALAPSPGWFATARFVAGLGLGGVVPTAIALTVEFAAPHRRSLTNALMFSGYSVGGLVAALTAIPVIPSLGWRAMFWIGLFPLVVIAPLCWLLLPESPSYLEARGRRDEADAVRRRFGLEGEPPAAPDEDVVAPERPPLATIFSRTLLRATGLFWMTTAMGLLLVYGLNTWLAQIMRESGYPLGPALAFLLVLNLGAIAGTPVAGALADRFGSRPVVAGMFTMAAVCIALLSRPAPTPVLLTLVALAGVGSVGTTIILNAWTAAHYPAHARATGLGWALAVGRLGAILGPIYGGFVLASSRDIAWNFYAFAVPAAVGALLVLAIPRLRRTSGRAAPSGRTPVTDARAPR